MYSIPAYLSMPIYLSSICRSIMIYLYRRLIPKLEAQFDTAINTTIH